MNKMHNTFTKLSLRWKISFIVLGIMTLTLFSVSAAVTSFSTRQYTEMEQKYYETAMNGVSYELNKTLSSIDELYLTFNSQHVFSEDTIRGETLFQTVSMQLELEKLVNNTVNANNLQSVICGTLLYIDKDNYYYVGTNPTQKDFNFTETEWYREFVNNGCKKTLYGPMYEDFKPDSTQKNYCLYYIAPYGTNKNSSAEKPFLLFTLKLNSLLEPIKNYHQDNRKILVLNDEGKTLYSNGLKESELSEIVSSFSRDDFGNNTFSEFVDAYYLCASNNNSYKWVIIFLDDTSTAFEKVNSINRTISFLISAFAILGIILTIITVKHLMMPLETLNQYIDIMQTAPDTLIDANAYSETGRIALRLNEMKQKIKEMDEQLYMLKLQERDAQVTALQAQINPHFIYNTMDNIYCMAELGQTEPIMSLSDNLSQMMQYSMSIKQTRVTVEEELNHIDHYIKILNIRFGDRIVFINDIDPYYYKCVIPKLILQPLVENAWQHGLLDEHEKGTILLTAEEKNGDLEICVENDGKSIDESTFEKLNKELEDIQYNNANYHPSHGIALANINNRLKLSYGSKYGVHFEKTEGKGCRVVVLTAFEDGFSLDN